MGCNDAVWTMDLLCGEFTKYRRQTMVAHGREMSEGSANRRLGISDRGSIEIHQKWIIIKKSRTMAFSKVVVYNSDFAGASHILEYSRIRVIPNVASRCHLSARVSAMLRHCEQICS
jgi:hypothetical protein